MASKFRPFRYNIPRNDLCILMNRDQKKMKAGSTLVSGTAPKSDDVLQQLIDSRRAALNLMEDAVLATRRTEESELLYRSLFNSIDEGFCTIEVIFENGKAVDYRFLEVNPAFVRHTGIVDGVGKTMREVAPDHEEFWFEIYGRIAERGEASRFEHEAAALGRYYDVYAFRLGGMPLRRVGILFRDISEQKRRERKLQFLAEASRELATAADFDDVMEAIGAKIGREFDVSIVTFADIDPNQEYATVTDAWTREGTTDPRGVYRIDNFIRPEVIATCRSGETLVVKDVENDDRVVDKTFLQDGGSLVSVPLAREGRWSFQLTLSDSVPRDWSDEEVEYVRELASHLWPQIERLRAERRLRSSTDLFLALIESAPFGVYLVDSRFRLLQVSEAAKRLFKNVEPLLGRDVAEVFRTIWNEPFATETIELFRRTLSTGEPYHSNETTAHRADSASVETYEWEIKRIVQPQGDFAVVCYFFDLTERRRSEVALQYSQERLRLLTDSFHDVAIFTTDQRGEIVTWNPGAQKIFGYAAGEIIGSDARKLFVVEDQETGVPDAEMATARFTGRASDERWHLHKSGKRFYASGMMVPLYEGEALVGYAKIARDLTAQKEAQEELRRQHEELEAIVAGRTAELAEANEALRYQMEHRLRIEAERNVLLQKVVTTQEDERRRIARDMHDSLGQQLTALRLKLASLREDHGEEAALVDQLEGLQELGAKLDSGLDFLVWELRPSILDDLGLAAAIEAFAREWSKHHGIMVEVHTGRFSTKRLDSDVETNLYRVMQEALNNASKHARANAVNIVLESRKEQVVLIVEDDGVGFDADSRSQNGDSAHGFGLLGMRERAAIIDGIVEIESRPGAGTTVFVRVPDGEKGRLNG